MYGFEAHISANKTKTTMLILVFILLMALLGWAAGYLLFPVDIESPEDQLTATAFGGVLVGVFVVIALVTTGVSYWFSDSIITRLVNARPANPHVYIEKYFIDTVEGLVLACGLPSIPRAFVIDSPALNAFATGRDPEHSLVAVTTGLLEKLDRQELEGVIAHEMSHIYNRDILLMGVSAVIVGGVSMFCHFFLRLMFYGGGGGGKRDSKGGCGGGPLLILALVLIILAPLFANLLNLMLSRKREYLADATAVKLTRNPDGLANALKKISGSDEKMPFVEKELSALFIDHPQKMNPAGRSWWATALATHPPIEDRIAALKVM
jgi:heat shock protein HtpX